MQFIKYIFKYKQFSKTSCINKKAMRLIQSNKNYLKLLHLLRQSKRYI